MTVLSIKLASLDDIELLTAHYRALWESYGVPDENIRDDAENIVRDFILDGWANRHLGAFLAMLDYRVVGSSMCEIERLPYPSLPKPQYRQHGYIWSVYVEPEARRQGVAAQLVSSALDHLRAIGCTTAVLHASAAGKSVYETAGFRAGPEMRLDL